MMKLKEARWHEQIGGPKEVRVWIPVDRPDPSDDYLVMGPWPGGRTYHAPPPHADPVQGQGQLGQEQEHQEE